MSRFLASLIKPLKLMVQAPLGSVTSPNITLIKPDNFLLSSVRTKVRCYFPRPNEVRRVRRHGWEFRMSTPNGRRVIMRRLLKGRFVLSH